MLLQRWLWGVGVGGRFLELRRAGGHAVGWRCGNGQWWALGGVATGGAGGNAGNSGGSGGTGNADPPGIDPNKLVSDLSDEEKAELCDWMVGLYGGYSMTTPCPVGSVQTFPSQEICVTAGLSFTCHTVTVGDVEACELSMMPSGGCDRSDPSCNAHHCM